MIKYVVGDLVRDGENYDLIAHGCNCFCSMGAGIAPVVKLKYPEAYEVDCKTARGDKSKLGTLSHTVTQTEPIVANLYTQYSTGGRLVGDMDLDYEALRNSLTLLKQKFSGKRMAFNKIGAGLAGGDWDIIERIINDVLVDEDVTVVLWEKEVN